MDGMKRPEIPALTSLRFFAAFWVVAYHYLTPALRADGRVPDWVADLCAAGFVGVPVFFVLSGFVLAYNYEGSDLRTGPARRAFYVARFARIYPVYLLAFLLAVPPALYALWTHQPGIASPRDHLVGLVLSPLLLQAWGGDAYRAWNTPGWTLSVEAAFYIAFPFLLARAAQGRLGRWLAGSTLLSATLLALHFLDQPWSPSTAFATRNPIVHLPAFLAGMWLATNRSRLAGLTARQADALAWTGTLGLLALCAVLAAPGAPPPEVANPLLNSLLPVPLVALVVIGLARPGSGWSRALAPAGLVHLGNISYSVYILQDPAAKYVLYAPQALLGVPLAGTYAGFALLACALLAASALTYQRVERPWQRRLRARLAPRAGQAAPAPEPAKAPESAAG